MQYITDMDEIMAMLKNACGEPVHTVIGTDADGNAVSVPMYQLNKEDEVEP